MPRPKPKLRGIPHLIGALVALPAVVMLARAAQDGIFTDAAIVYGASLMCLLTSSATYHTPYWAKPIRGRLRSVDHAMIYVLIGGSYVPESNRTVGMSRCDDTFGMIGSVQTRDYPGTIQGQETIFLFHVP